MIIQVIRLYSPAQCFPIFMLRRPINVLYDSLGDTQTIKKIIREICFNSNSNSIINHFIITNFITYLNTILQN